MTAPSLGDDRLREALALRSARAVPSSDCPEPGVLWDLASGSLDRFAARGHAAHAVGCAACREALRLAREAGATERAVASTVIGARAWAPWLAAAAVLIVAVGVTELVRRAGEPVAPPPAFREEPSVRIDAESPRADVRAGDGVVLRWTAIEGARYDLTLARENLDVLAVARGLERPDYLVPAETASMLRPGERLLWQVEATLADGRRIRSETFSVRLE